MFSSLKKLKIFFTVCAVISIFVFGTAFMMLIGQNDYLDGQTFPLLFLSYLAVIAIPLLMIVIAVFLHLLDKELEAESCSVSRRIAELEKRIEKTK